MDLLSLCNNLNRLEVLGINLILATSLGDSPNGKGFGSAREELWDLLGQRMLKKTGETHDTISLQHRQCREFSYVSQ